MTPERLKELEPFWGCWHIKRQLGEGGFGAVYEIERNEFGTSFSAALKVMSVPQNQSEYRDVLASGMESREVHEYFRGVVADMAREFSLMDKVKGHTNIVDYADHQVLERKDGFGWDVLIRMELLIPLEGYAVDNPLSVEDVIRLGVDLCKALEVCEANKIIHRDIKPANIFLTRNGDFKLGDFGIARVAERSRGATTKIGTPTYMAPEVYGNKKYDHTVDIYSLGLVLFRYLNNNRLPYFPPYPQKITFELKEEAISRRMTDPSDLPNPIKGTPDLWKIIKKACAFYPQNRYQSVKEMRYALEELLYADRFTQAPTKRPPAAQDPVSQAPVLQQYRAQQQKPPVQQETKAQPEQLPEPNNGEGKWNINIQGAAAVEKLMREQRLREEAATEAQRRIDQEKEEKRRREVEKQKSIRAEYERKSRMQKEAEAVRKEYEQKVRRDIENGIISRKDMEVVNRVSEMDFERGYRDRELSDAMKRREGYKG